MSHNPHSKGDATSEAEANENNAAAPGILSRLSNSLPILQFHDVRQSAFTPRQSSGQTPCVGLRDQTLSSLTQITASRSEHTCKELQELREAFLSLRQSYDAQESRTATLTHVLKQNEEDLRSVRLQLANTREELTSCKDDLFRLQPASQMPDTDLAKDLAHLCDNVVSWIDEEILLFEDANPGAQPGQLFHDGGSKHFGRLFQMYPNIGEYLVRYEVHRLLQRSILDSDKYLLGLDKTTTDVLTGIENEMRNSKCPREVAAIRNWRSETLNALANNEAYIKARQHVLRDETKDVFARISNIFPIIRISKDSKKRFNEQVAIPAGSLARKIQLSVSSYNLWVEIDPGTKYNPIQIGILDHFRFIDQGTGRALKMDNVNSAESNGEIGDIIIPLEPYLTRANEGRAETILRQGTYLLRLHRPLKKYHYSFGNDRSS